jgi:hypothetical protein
MKVVKLLCRLRLEEISVGVVMGGISVIECKVLENVGGLLLVVVSVLWRVPKFGSGISVSGELVQDFNHLKVSRFQIFKSCRFPPENNQKFPAKYIF